jgi:MerR-like DNA binding protein
MTAATVTEPIWEVTPRAVNGSAQPKFHAARSGVTLCQSSAGIVAERGVGHASWCASCMALMMVEKKRPQGFSTAAELIASATITYRQCTYWTKVGLLIATEQAPGTGNVRFYSPTEVEVTRVMGRLVAAGVEPHAACRAARNGGQLAPGVRIVLDEAA